MGTCCTTSNILKSTDAKWFNLDGYSGECFVEDVYDGDTVTIRLIFCKQVFKTRCRLLGIDCAEIRTKNAEEKQHGLLAKKYLQDLILGKIIWIRIGKDDKYGRPLGTLYITKSDFNKNINSVNNNMVVKGWAKVYDGKKKIPFTFS